MEPIGILEDTLEVQELSKEHSDERERQKEMYLEQSEITIARKKWKWYLKTVERFMSSRVMLQQ